MCNNHFLPDNYKGFCAKIAIFYFYASIREVCSSFYSNVSYSWMLHNASGFYLQLFLCNSLQIFIFSKHLPLDNRCFLSPSSLISSFHTGTIRRCLDWGGRSARTLDPHLTLELSLRFVLAVQIARADLNNRLISPIIIFTLHRGLKIRMIRPRKMNWSHMDYYPLYLRCFVYSRATYMSHDQIQSF